MRILSHGFSAPNSPIEQEVIEKQPKKVILSAPIPFSTPVSLTDEVALEELVRLSFDSVLHACPVILLRSPGISKYESFYFNTRREVLILSSHPSPPAALLLTFSAP